MINIKSINIMSCLFNILLYIVKNLFINILVSKLICKSTLFDILLLFIKYNSNSHFCIIFLFCTYVNKFSKH